ncbi:3-deoxy-7-phosphoheptulonate synthase [Weissella uvarum]|uniref:3-deoxy-7-phosphoheptulonate synthase n=1 Tax=Weissella uvarum TaxID=1479233 RepID=UPI0019619F4C|nr:3-deoxy-7-phosphoheptulonate synthase [Weissella uvarum]MBM7617172.1 3-deoxy-7-phosphoheptulonate synthase [Weissella uvarum]MCM0595468.1 3-deoxy-7-phosphoheptulonate synthase [Weissella uvarum]
MIMIEMPNKAHAQALYEQIKNQTQTVPVFYNGATKVGLADEAGLVGVDLPVEAVVRHDVPGALQVSRIWQAEDTIIKTEHSQIGGSHFTLVAGPDSIESQQHVMKMAQAVKDAGGTILRGGSFKPRTNPYSFQGYGAAGLKAHRQAADAYELDMMTEIMDARDFDLIDQYTDIFQVGARNMQNFSLLKCLGEQKKPVGLKRGMSASIDDLLNAAEYIVAAGNPNVFLIERGIRTFDNQYTRNTLDVGAVPVLQKYSHLPVLVDPSHAAGVSEFVAPLARAGVAAGAQGLMIEIHDNPKAALVDGAQALTPAELEKLMQQVQAISAILEENES